MPLTPSPGAAVFLRYLVAHALHGELTLADELCLECLELRHYVILAKCPDKLLQLDPPAAIYAICSCLVHFVSAMDGVLQLGLVVELLAPLPQLEVVLKVHISAGSVTDRSGERRGSNKDNIASGHP